MKRLILITLALVWVLAAVGPFVARADVINPPSTDEFLERNKNKCELLCRSFLANGEDGSIKLMKEPGSKTVKSTVNNEILIFIQYTYNHRGTYWGYANSENNAKTGWVPMNQLLLRYDHISFQEDHSDEIYIYEETINYSGDVVIWTWPGSGVIDDIYYDADWQPYRYYRPIEAYKDNEGREWIRRWYADGTSAWFCLSDPTNEEIAKFNPAAEPAPWQPGGSSAEQTGGASQSEGHTASNSSSGQSNRFPGGGNTEQKSRLPLPVLPIIMVAVIVIGTAVLIRVFMKNAKHKQ